MRPVLRSLAEPFPLPRIPVLEQRNLLLAACDSYCLFCECPLGNDARVTERMTIPGGLLELPAGGIATDRRVRIDRRIRFFWGGLTLCCGACANAKDGAPDFRAGLTAGAANVAAMLDNMANPARQLEDWQTDALYQIAAAQWIWPDSAEDGTAESRIGFRGDDTWNLFRLWRVARSQNDLVVDRVLTLAAGDEAKDWARQPGELPWVYPRAGVQGLDLVRAQTTISTLKLNSLNPDEPWDQRVRFREHAWQTAGLALGALEQAAGMPNANLLQLSLHPYAGMVRATLRATGFWRAWAEQFVERMKSGADPWSRFEPSVVDAFLASLLVQYETPSGTPFGAQEGNLDEETAFTMVLAGTDVTRLPRALGGPL
jgi:hypothetical protein